MIHGAPHAGEQSCIRHGESPWKKKGDTDMIRLTGLDGSILYINYFQIMFIELIPETKVVLTNGRYYLVKDSIEAVQKKIEAFIHGCITLENRDLLAPMDGDDRIIS